MWISIVRGFNWINERIFFFLASAILIPTSALWAGEIEHQLIRKIAVFPIAEANYSSAEDAWWQMREVLTKDQKLMVATRRFMINRGVFQARKTLKPADVVILSKILDAQALIVTFFDDRNLRIKVYEGENGYLLWQGERASHPAIPMSDQIIKLATGLMTEFTHALPYQSYQVVDEVIGKAIYESDDKNFARAFVGSASPVHAGDPVQWVSVKGDPTEAFFGDKMKIVVIAEGIVKQTLGEQVEIEITKARDLSELKQDSLIRFPQEVSKLRDLYSKEDKTSSLGAEILSAELKDPKDFKNNHSSTATALAFIANLATLILLAF